MKKYIHSFCIIFILLVPGIIIKAQDTRIRINDITEKRLKELNSKADFPERSFLLNHETVLRNIQENKKKLDAAFSYKSLSEINAGASDSAYIYEWEDAEWLLKRRNYYSFDISSIEILQEKLIWPDSLWTSYSKRVLEYFNSGRLKKETDYFWQNSSIQWLPAYVEEYNSSGKNIEMYSKIWNDTTEQFTGGYRIASSYLNDTLLSVEILQYWEPASNVWKNAVRTEITYSNSLITKNTQKIWKETEWINDHIIEYSHSEYGDLLTETGRIWDTIANIWINEYEIERDYNTLGNVTNILFKQWDNQLSTWVNKYNKVISYNDQFRISSNLTQKWDVDSWTDSMRIVYSYNAQGLILQYLEENWNGNAWINDYREVYTYQSDQVTIEFNNWDEDSSKWEKDMLITYQFDVFGYIIKEQHDFWNSSLNLYETGYYDLYDEDGDNTEHFEKIWDATLNKFTEGIRVLNSFFPNEDKDIKQTILQEWDPDMSEWKNRQKTEYYWSGLVSAESAYLSDAFKLYPVPFTDIINIENISSTVLPSILKIIDLSGRIIYETDLSDIMMTIDFSHLQKGIYFAEINSKAGKSIIKIMKY